MTAKNTKLVKGDTDGEDAKVYTMADGSIIQPVIISDTDGNPNDSTQPIHVSVGNFPASTGLTDEQLRDSPVPVSMTGASTETTLAALKEAIDVLSLKITACNTGAVTLDTATLLALENVTAAISGSVAVTGPLTDTQLRATALPISGTVTANTGLTQPLTDTQLRATALPVSGNVGVTGSVEITNDSGNAIPISGTVTANTGLTQPLTDTQLRATALPVSGTFFQTTQPVSIASAVAVTGSFYQATQPISATVLPLPADAATQTTLAALKSVADTINTAADAIKTAVEALNTKTTACNTGAISGTVTANTGLSPLTDAQLRDSPVPVSGTVTANTGLTQPLTDTQLREESVETTGVMDWFLRRLYRAAGRLSFDTSNQLLCVLPTTAVTVSSGTVTAMTQGNMSMGDMGKPATVQLMTRLLSANGYKRNLIRS